MQNVSNEAEKTMKITIEFETSEEAKLAMSAGDLLADIVELREVIRSHFKYQTPETLSMDEVYTTLNEIIARYEGY